MLDLRSAVKSGLRKAGFEIRRIGPATEGAFVPEFVAQAIKAIDDSLDKSSTRQSVFLRLRSLSLTDFGLLLLSMPNTNYPILSGLLPRMAAKEVQISWTGDSGIGLFKQTLDFVKSMSYSYSRLTGKSLDNATILDFGCGYGRILRMMYYFSGESNVCGVDPWDKSIEICRADGLQNVFVSDYLPSSLPVAENSFDLIYAFSVFTHLSERATLTCLKILHKYLSNAGLLVITLRPVEYWAIDWEAVPLALVSQQQDIHRQRGFSFRPHPRPPVDGDITYGETSISLEWLARTFPEFRVAGLDRSLSDPYQIYVYLRKR